MEESRLVCLSELNSSETGVITRVFGAGSFRKRITEMGFIRGKRVRVIKNAPLQDPVEYEVMGYRVALRRAEAEMIEVIPVGGTAGNDTPMLGENATFDRESPNRFLHESGNTVNVALVGNPNSGKTSLFNVVSGANERVGNYGGVTVDAKTVAFSRRGYRFNLSDLPGTYSITEYTPEELYVRSHILERTPDVVINVVDASNLERNLYLTSQLIDMNLKVVIALNMHDELAATGATFDYVALGRMIGIPIVPTVASRGQGMDELFHTVIDVFEDNEPVVRHVHINYGEDIERGISELQTEIWKNRDLMVRYSSRYIAIKLLEGDKSTERLLSGCPNRQDIIDLASHGRTNLEKNHGDRPETLIANAKYGFIDGALGETFRSGPLDRHARTGRIDAILTHKWLGFPIFILLMWAMFQTTFSLGAYPAEWMEAGVAWLGNWVADIVSEGPLRDLLVDGVIAGVGGVIVFL
ncbi:MAG: fused ferrous iron transport protein A/B, partial [Rikenellaceae bacterium]|nr:fused ferrous iron transport protein A/B [Rikenellaceae bacterium]